MQHVLSECRAPGQEIIWEMTRYIWMKKGQEWPGKHLGIVLGCTTVDFADEEMQEQENKAKAAGTNRLYRVLITEAMRQIWVLRCARVISDRQSSNREVYNKWKHRINQVLKVDRQMCNKKLFREEARAHSTVISTW
ncbi:hypothetical protein FISHEDRAFT_29456, partial [Fistulina hepatica ATCC 64428]